MDYRTTKQGYAISTIRIGGVHLHERTARKLNDLVSFAREHGVNLIDFATAYEEPIRQMGEARPPKPLLFPNAPGPHLHGRAV